MRPTGLETTCNNQLVVLPTLQTTLGERVLIVGDCCFLKLRDFRKTVVNTLTPFCYISYISLYSPTLHEDVTGPFLRSLGPNMDVVTRKKKASSS